MLSLLRDVILVAESFDSIIHLHAYIYLAQELKIISPEYCFDYSLNIPFSKKVEDGFAILNQEGFIIEVGNGRRFMVPDEKLKEGVKNISEHKISQLKKITLLDPEVLINIAHLLFLAGMNPELKIQENKENFQKKARRTFFMNLTSFNDSFSRLNDLVGGLSGV